MSNNFLSQLNLFNDSLILFILFIISSEDSSSPYIIITSCFLFLPNKYKINYLA